MRVVRHTPQHVTITTSEPVLWILGISFLLAGLALTLLLSRVVTLTCDRSLPPNGACTLTSSNYVTSKTYELPLDQIQGAEVQISYGDSDSDDTYRVVLITTQGTVPFTGYYSSGSQKKQQTADQVNRFLTYESQQNLSLKVDDRVWMSILGGVFAGAGLLMALLAGFTVINLDRSSGMLTVTRNRLITKSTSEYMISEFKGAEIQGSNGTYRVALLMKDGQAFPLTSYYSSGTRGKQKLIDELQRFADLTHPSI